MSTTTLTPLPTPATGPVTVTGSTVHLDGLTLTHGMDRTGPGAGSSRNRPPALRGR